jgi:uncharacterized membrane protein YagU involved in acid resistance
MEKDEKNQLWTATLPGAAPYSLIHAILVPIIRKLNEVTSTSDTELIHG